MCCKQRQGRQVQRWVNNLRGEETEIFPSCCKCKNASVVKLSTNTCIDVADPSCRGVFQLARWKFQHKNTYTWDLSITVDKNNRPPRNRLPACHVLLKQTRLDLVLSRYGTQQQRPAAKRENDFRDRCYF